MAQVGGTEDILRLVYNITIGIDPRTRGSSKLLSEQLRNEMAKDVQMKKRFAVHIMQDRQGLQFTSSARDSKQSCPSHDLNPVF